MNPEYSGEKVDLEVARYGLRTFRTLHTGDPRDHNWLYKMLLADYSHRFPVVDQDTVLGPVYISHPGSWADGTCKAECLRKANYSVMVWGSNMPVREVPPEEHAAPDLVCNCGIYACHTLDHLKYQYPSYTQQVIAVVAAEGQTIMGTRGFRTEYARVVAYWCCDQLRGVCERQFKDAAPHTDIDEMLEAYNLRRNH